MRKIIMFILMLIFGIVGCTSINNVDNTKIILEKNNTNENKENNDDRIVVVEKSIDQLKQEMLDKYKKQVPEEWGDSVTGLIRRINTSDKVVAITLDACGGGSLGNGYDTELIDFLVSNEIPATLFINARWIDANKEIFMKLANNDLFEIENHGLKHKPLSVNGEKAYGIKGTMSIEEVVDEVEVNAEKIKELTGKKPKYFRSGTAYYDDVAVNIVKSLGYEAVNFTVIGDAGATYNKEQVKKACLSSKPGDILIFHMNRPERETAEGMKEGIILLQEKGFDFVKLEDYPLTE